MDSVYDWVTVGLFAGLVVLFLQRSTADEDGHHQDSVLPYLVAGVGCAAANYLGNKGMHIPAVLLIVATVAFIAYFLRPFGLGPRA